MGNAESNVVAIREGLLTTPLLPLDQVRLIGNKCKDCGEVTLGEGLTCANCAGENTQAIPLSRKGKLWTYTVIKHQPPGSYRGAVEPFVPFVEGLVELPDGIRVLSVIDVPMDKVKIGMDLELVVFKLYKDDQGNDVVAFKFKAA